MRTRAVLTMAVLLLAVVSISGCTEYLSDEYSSEALSLSASPFQIIDIPGEFNATRPTYANFYDSDPSISGYFVSVPAIDVFSDHISVVVPPYFNYRAGTFASGNLSVNVTQVFDGYDMNYKPKPIFISDMPTTKASSGVVTLAYLEAMLNVSTSIKLEGIIDTPKMRAAIAKDRSILENLTAAVKELMANPSKKIYLGTMGNNTLLFGIDDIKNTDRMIYAMLVAQANAGSSDTGNSATGMLAFVGCEGCMECEARSTADLLSTGKEGILTGDDLRASMTYWGNAPRTSALCKAATATKTGFEFVGSVAAASAGLASLGGATMAAARVSSVMLYLSTTLGGGLIEIGGVLGQATEDAKQLVINGVDKMEDSLRTAGLQLASQIKVGVGKWDIEMGKANDIYDVFSGANGVRSAFSEVSTVPKKFYTLTIDRPSPPYTGFRVVPSPWSGFGECSVTCEIAYAAGQSVTITPFDDENIELESWSGDCIGKSTCTVTMDRNRKVSMSFKEKEQERQNTNQQDTGQQDNNQQNDNVPSDDDSAAVEKPTASIDSVSCEPYYAYGEMYGWDFKLSGKATGPVGTSLSSNVYTGPDKQKSFAMGLKSLDCASWTMNSYGGCRREEGQPEETAWTSSGSWGYDYGSKIGLSILSAKFYLHVSAPCFVEGCYFDVVSGWSCPGG